MSDWQPPKDLIELMNRARRIAFGTAASLVEILQDPEKRDANLKKLTEDLTDLADELAEKGQQTEMEARRYVDSILSPNSPGSPSPARVEPLDFIPNDAKPSDNGSSSEEEIRELTQQIHSLREELERLRKADSDT